MKSRILIVLMSLTALGLTSCNDYLELTPTDRVSDKAMWESETATDLYINNFYEYLSVYSPFGEGQFKGNLTEGLTDTFKYGSYIAGNRAGDCNNYVFTPETISASGCILDCWSDTYTRIRRINEFLDAMTKYSVYSADVNERYEAQARFFRAFLYFQLAKRHKGYTILYSNLSEMKKDMELSEPEKTWQFIYDDLTFAGEKLPSEWNSANEGRLTKGAAYGLLSRVMLYAERWDDAKAAAEKVFELNKYDLAPTYEQAYAGGNIESILEFNYLVTGPSHYWDRYMAMYHEYTTGGSSTPTQEMVEEYEYADGGRVDWTPWHTETGTTQYPPYNQLEPRFAATILYNGAEWQGNVMENCVNGTYGIYVDYGTESYPYGKTVTGYYLRKFRQESNTDLTNVPSTTPWVEIRFAEVLLNHAEACYRLNLAGDALSSLSRVRSRVGLGTDMSLTGDDLFEAIRHERKVELSYEGHLWWDMRRWGLAQEAYSDYRVHGIKITKDSAGTYTYTYVDCDGEDRTFLSRMYSLPIPTEELNNNSLVSQFDEWNF